jgi:maltooligosyltrehalose trehalohydrolase
LKRAHAMPFGAELAGDAVRFRLWAPGVQSVQLSLEAHRAQPALLPMHSRGGGWFELETKRAAPGSRYRFRLPDGLNVPDPASRFNPDDVHGPSEVVDPSAFDWGDDDWRGRPWREAVLYELHVGAFSEEGTFAGVESRLAELAALGVTAIELMPVADFPGRRNWGYDGVLPYAPESAYGRPEDLKRLVQAAHRRGLMVLLDVVYNHFGPDGNYLHAYAPSFFTDRHRTPWGAAINFDGADARPVRDFFIHNALYWIEEYHLDGLRLDAVHAIRDASARHILDELAAAVRAGPGRGRHVHLVLENDANQARFLGTGDDRFEAQWNDDIHHCLHVLVTGETDGYYSDYAREPSRLLARCLSEGFAWQGEPSPYRAGERRGEPSAHLPPGHFVAFLQNHDQVGNRAFGERLVELTAPRALRAAVEILLLAPSPPLLFMGEEWATRRRFPFFCDFSGDLARAVTEGRRGEFARFERFRDPAAQRRIPDPCAEETFLAAKLDASERLLPAHRDWWALHSRLLALRRNELAPRLESIVAGRGGCSVLGERGIEAGWTLGDLGEYRLLANLGDESIALRPLAAGRTLYASDDVPGDMRTLPPWSVAWRLEPER